MNSDQNNTGLKLHLTHGQMLNYLRQTLSREENHFVEKHLVDCELCSDALLGLKKLEADSSILTITEELQKIARKRKVRKKKIFSQVDLVTLFALLFLLIFLFFVAMYMVWNK